MEKILNRIFLVLFIFTAFATLQAAFEEKGAGSFYLGSGGSGLASADSTFIALLNPAKLARVHHPRMDFSFHNFYELGALNQITLSGALPRTRFPLGFAVSRYGNKLYSEMDLRIALAWPVSKILAFGLSLNGYWLAIKNYGNSATMGFNLAGWYRICSNLSAAFMLENLNEPVIGSVKEKLPVRMVMALSYTPLPKIELNMDVVKENRFAFDFRFGLRCQINRWLGLLSGFRDKSRTFSLGFYLNAKHIIFSYAFEYHQTLGNSHSLSLGYEF